MKRLALGLVILASLTSAPAAVASHGAPGGFVGNWTSVDCATWWEPLPDGSLLVDCSVWGDGSAQTLHIGPGDSPRVTFQDSYASTCANAGSQSTRWIGTGYGEYDADQLWANLTQNGCGAYRPAGPIVFPLHWDPGSDTLWSDGDGDGWGTVWHRAN